MTLAPKNTIVTQGINRISFARKKPQLTQVARRPARNITTLLALSAVLAFARSAAAKDFSAAEVERLSAGNEQTAICGEGVGPSAQHPLPTPDDGPARFVFDADGALSIAAANARTLSFRFPKVGPRAVVKFETVGTTVDTIACGEVVAAKSYTIVAAAGSIVRVQVFDTARDADEKLFNGLLGDEKKRVFTAAQQNEQDAVHRTPHMRELKMAGMKALEYPAGANLLDVETEANAALAALDKVETMFSCSAHTNDELMATAICEETESVAVSVRAVAAIAAHARSGSTNDYEALSLLQWHKFGDALAALKTPLRWSSDDTKQQCDYLGQLRWLSLKGARRLVARAEVPATQASETLEMTYGEIASDRNGADASARWGLLVSGVPRGANVSSVMNMGKAIAVDLATILSSFIAYTIKAPQTHLSTLVDLSPCKENPQSAQCEIWKTAEKAREEAAEDAARAKVIGIESLICTNREEKFLLVVDGAVPPAGKTESRAWVLGPIKPKNVSNIAVCASATCSGGDDDKNVKSRMALIPDRRGTVTLLAELSFGVGLVDTSGNSGFSIMNQAAFETLLEGQGPDQIYELRQRIDPRNAFSTSILLALRTTDTTLVGIGPALLVGTSGGTFTQWNARFGVTLTKGLYFTLGPSFRLLPEPENYSVGDRVSVPKNASTGGASPPALVSHYGGELQWDFGLAFDLASLGTLATDTVKSFGGK